jgi:hypothetical protein
MTFAAPIQELAYRNGDGIEVALLWSEHANEVSVVIGDSRTGESFRFSPPRDKALDAFHHPFAYAPAEAELETMTRREPVYA